MITSKLPLQTSNHHRITAIVICLVALSALGCDKPQRKVPAGPGVGEAALSAKVDEIPKAKAALAGSQLTAEQQAIVVAEIGQRKITLGELESRLAGEPGVVRAQFATVAKRKEYLASWVQFEVLAEEAARQGLAKDPEVVESTRSQMVRRYLKESVAGQVKAEDVTDAEVKAYYEANVGLYQKPEQVELRHLLLSDKAAADKVRHELEAGAEGSAAKLNVLWQDYVGRVSLDKATATQLGSLGLVSRQPPANAPPAEKARLAAIPAALIEAGMALEPYKLGPIVATEAGFHVIMVTSKSPAIDRKLDDAKRAIRRRVLKRKRDARRKELLDGLRGNAGVEINDDAVRLLPLRGPPKPRSKGASLKTGSPLAAPPAAAKGTPPATPTDTATDKAETP